MAGFGCRPRWCGYDEDPLEIVGGAPFDSLTSVCASWRTFLISQVGVSSEPSNRAVFAASYLSLSEIQLNLRHHPSGSPLELN